MGAQGDVNLRQDRQTDQVLLAERAGMVSPSAVHTLHLMSQVVLLLFPGLFSKISWDGRGNLVFCLVLSFLRLVLATSCHCHRCLGDNSWLLTHSAFLQQLFPLLLLLILILKTYLCRLYQLSWAGGKNPSKTKWTKKGRGERICRW